MKIPDDIAAKIALLNNTPMDGFLGRSPAEVHLLLYDTFGDNSPVQFRNDIDDPTLDQIPVFRILEDFLKIIQRDRQIKLTPLGALPKKIMVELYGKRYLLEEDIENGITKLWREQDSISIMSARLTAEIAGLVKKRSGKLTLTKTAAKLLDTNNRLQVFQLFFRAFTEKFLWSFNDGYPEQPIGQYGWAFSLLMLDKFGNQPKTADFYAAHYLKAFPKFLTFFGSRYTTPERQFFRCYGVRTFNRFFLWFGFVTVARQKNHLDLNKDTFKRTDLVKKIFIID
jgi:hypothetical protein